jgi:hypothetical protein
MFPLRKPQAFGFPRVLPAGLLIALAASGCQTATGTGAAAGGAIGAGVGGLVSRCPGGAVLGGLIGAGTGALAGAGVDAVHRNKAERAAAADVALRAPTLEQVVAMTQNAVPTAQIVNQIQTSGAVYRLTPDNVTWLNQQGVHPAVIQAMQNTAYTVPRRVVYTSAPAYVVEPVVVPPPVAVGVGVGFAR